MVMFCTITFLVFKYVCNIDVCLIDNLNDTSSEISSVSSYRTSRYNIFTKLL